MILIGPFTQLLTLAGLPNRGSIADEQLEIIPNAGIIVENGYIQEVGRYDSLLEKTEAYTQKLEVASPSVAMPGLVDAHTHICFGGSRAQDYAMRNAGKSYLEIAQAGGGIWDTVTQTRKASLEQLRRLTVERANKHLSSGITTIEVKSGYGLSVEEELKMLRAIKKANEQTQADLIPTCLAAHTLPKDFRGDASDYLELISSQLFPLIAEEGLAKRVDSFVEASAFTTEQISPYYQKAKALGFDLTIHADQFTSCGASQLAVEMGALSADHLEASTEREIEILAKSRVIAMALPGASLGLGCPFTPARKLLDAGGRVGIATDWNPGSAPMGDLLAQGAILGTFEKLSNAEVLTGMTLRAAQALGLNDRGSLERGKLADIIAFPTSDYREILYHQGQLKPNWVLKKGTLSI